MQFSMRILLLAALLLCPLAGYGVVEPPRESKPPAALPPGDYGACAQKMVLGPGGAVSYGDNLSLTQIRVEPDGSLEATFPTEAGSNAIVHLKASTPEHSRAVWTSDADGLTYQAKATPHSEETYSFRLEVRRAGKLVAGSQVFCAICKAKGPPQK